MTAPRTRQHRQPKNSDQAYNIALTTRVSQVQEAAVRQACGTEPVSVWLRRLVQCELTRRSLEGL